MSGLKPYSTINTFFDHIFCLTLDRRPDRRLQAEQEFEKHGILNVEFISGVDGKELTIPDVLSTDGLKVSPGDLGCTLSHLKIIQLAKERKYKSVLIFEDDVELKTEFINAGTYITYIPPDWQMIYLGGDDIIVNHLVNNFFRRTFGVNTTHAYAIKSDSYDLAIDALSKHEKVDLTLRTIHDKIPTYICSPKLASQRDGFSDILEKETKYPEWIK